MSDKSAREWWDELPGSIQAFVLVALIFGTLFLWAKCSASDESSCPPGFVGTLPDGTNCAVRQGDQLCFNDPATGMYTCAPILDE